MEVPSNALIDTKKITYDWFDYVLKNAKKPEILKDKINYFVMGENQWRHAPSLTGMANGELEFYLNASKKNGKYRLQDKLPSAEQYLTQTVDFKDRQTSNNDYYPSPIIRKKIDTSNGLIFFSEPLKEDMIINGAFTGEIVASINRRDMDFGITLYELNSKGEYFHLSYVIDRASFSKDRSQRHLLEPHEITRLTLPSTRMVSKQLKKGSRIVVYLNINKNAFAQLNYGSGKDVSDETLLDANEKLIVKWYAQSVIRIPVLRSTPKS